MRLLHVNYDKRAGVVFLRAEPQQGTATADCGHGVPTGWDGKSDLAVGDGEMICVAATRAVHVSWHARSGVQEAPAGVQHAMKE